MLNRFAQHAIARVLCELLCLELFNVFFQHENRFRYKFFDIVQFSRSCKRLSRPADDLIILPQKWFFVKYFFQKFFDLFELVVRFSTYPYWFFRFASAAFRSHSFRRPLALKYNTTSRHVWQPLFSLFSFFLSFVYNGQFFSPSSPHFWQVSSLL